jgi:Zn2+/Cd2+-exporting ATPase
MINIPICLPVGIIYVKLRAFPLLSSMANSTFPNFQEHPEALAAGGCALLLVLAAVALQCQLVPIGLILLGLAYIIGGYTSALEGLTTLWEERELDVDLLMIVAAIGAALLGWWQQELEPVIDGAVLILIFAISGVLESYALNRTERSIQSLMSLTLDQARLINGHMMPIKQLQIGDRILVKPGELIPTDAKIVAGSSSINQAAITGESLPVDKIIGNEVFGGTINGTGLLELEIHQPPASSLLQRIIQLVQQAQTENTPTQDSIENFERTYAKIIVISGMLIAILPAVLGWWSWENSIYRALIFLVVASPCALMAAIMPGLLSGIANGARQGILLKNGIALESIGQVQVIAFDKTGTLTTGQLRVSEIWYLDAQDQIQHDVTEGLSAGAKEILGWAAAIEFGSEHLIGQAILQLAVAHGVSQTIATKVTAEPGVGISGWQGGELIIVGKAQPDRDWGNLAQDGKTVAWVTVNGQIRGAITCQDYLRPEAINTIKSLQKLGITPIMLTGDNQASAQLIGKQLGITEIYANLLPTDKVRILRDLQAQYTSVAMVGDGINDAPALAAATVGVAMGRVGSDAALETADMVLMTDNLQKLVTAVQLGRRTQSVIQQNIVFALGFIGLLLIGNFTEIVNLPLGVLGHEGSTVLVTLSGLRLLRS